MCVIFHIHFVYGSSKVLKSSWLQDRVTVENMDSTFYGLRAAKSVGRRLWHKRSYLLLRPHDVSRQEFMFASVLFWHPRSYLGSQMAERRLVKSIPEVWILIVDQNSLRHFAQSSSKFTGVKKCEILPRFSPLTYCSFKKEKHSGDLIPPPW